MLDVINFSFQAIKAAPIEAVGSTAMAGSKAAQDMSFIGLFMQADFVVQTVMAILILASIWSWAIIFEKWTMMKSIKSRSNAFQKSFWSGASLETLHENTKTHGNHPMAKVFCAAMKEWQSRDNKSIQTNQNLRAGTKERINQAMVVAGSKSLEQAEKNLSFLAIVGSSATFIGLFGTVWGIMTSFQAIAISKNTTLAVVAPGIAEALLATAFGLVAAIPAKIFYDKFANEINGMASNLNNFSNELSAILTRELDKIK